MNETVAKAAALLAEVDAAAQYKNGTLHTDYSEMFQNHEKAPAHVGRFVNSSNRNGAATAYWMDTMNPDEHGQAPFVNDYEYSIFWSVKFYCAVGDGVHDDTAAFNLAIQDGKRCGKYCLSSTVSPRAFSTQIVGNPNNLPVIKASVDFVGKDGTTRDHQLGRLYRRKWWSGVVSPVANFYRQVRNLRIDISVVKALKASCIHWQTNAENGSGGYMGNLNFYGGAIGIDGGEQQFTANEMYFSGCRVAVQVTWDWGYSCKSIYVINADIAFKMLLDDGTHGIGSIHIQDATILTTKIGVQVFPITGARATGNTAILLDNVGLDNFGSLVVYTNGKVLLGGGANDSLQVDVWSVESQYAMGDNYWDGETDIDGDVKTDDTAAFQVVFGYSIKPTANGLVQIGDGSDDIKIYNLINIGAQVMVVNDISANNRMLSMLISADDNLFSTSPPWWSIINILGLSEAADGDNDKIFPPHRNFFALGDSSTPAAVAARQALSKTPRRTPASSAIYVDVDHVYNGHRFCEPGYSSPDSTKNWFFNVATSDVHSDLSIVPDDDPMTTTTHQPLFDISSIDPKTCTSPQFCMPDVPGRAILCVMSAYFRANNNKPL
ncbi:hypothetical protein B0H63DRAFT_529120 [Podospora didyma]|uniref:Rhamnogalacturonase A/B/Epimerase-like pectate lyase domain-containing protein n=1 Tax=Podospora didyma TaxID=330526 RepID=A0AAE0K2B1_9PEZI|nr:hypothetical protein B0H63DRAFT_529120 [Podospora didyma]